MLKACLAIKSQHKTKVCNRDGQPLYARDPLAQIKCGDQQYNRWIDKQHQPLDAGRDKSEALKVEKTANVISQASNQCNGQPLTI